MRLFLINSALHSCPACDPTLSTRCVRCGWWVFNGGCPWMLAGHFPVRRGDSSLEGGVAERAVRLSAAVLLP